MELNLRIEKLVERLGEPWPEPSDEDIRLALSGNLCRCTGYTKVFDAVREAAQVMREGGPAS